MKSVSFDDVQDSLARQKNQRESVRGKTTNFRSVFKVREKYGSVSYFYHETLQDAKDWIYEGPISNSPFTGYQRKSVNKSIEKIDENGKWKRIKP